MKTKGQVKGRTYKGSDIDITILGELTYEQKKAILIRAREYDPRIDISFCTPWDVRTGRKEGKVAAGAFPYITLYESKNKVFMKVKPQIEKKRAIHKELQNQ